MTIGRAVVRTLTERCENPSCEETLVKECRTSEDCMIAYRRNKALKTLEKKGEVMVMYFSQAGSGPNSRECEKLQGVPSVHGV